MAIYHLGKCLDKLTLHSFRAAAVRKVIRGAYAHAARHGIALEELQESTMVVPRGTTCVGLGGGGGQGLDVAVKMGLDRPHTTKLQVSESDEKPMEIPSEKLKEESGESQMGGGGVESGEPHQWVEGEKIFSDGRRFFTEEEAAVIAAAEGPQWPQKATVRVLGPCPNPRLWSGVIHQWPPVGEYREGMESVEKACSLEAPPRGGRWRVGQEVEATLVRGGGSPVYRAC